MPSLADILKLNFGGDFGRIPGGDYPSPIQPPQGGTPGGDSVVQQTTDKQGKQGDTLSSIASGFNLPDYNTPAGIQKSLETILGPRPTMDEAVAAARKEFGDYNVAPPNRSDYQYQAPKMGLGTILGGLGVLLGGGNLGAYARGADAALQRQQYDVQARLRAQQDYDTALRNYQSGKVGWTKDIVQAARDRLNAWRSEAATLAPYTLMRQGDILRAQTEAHREGLRYLTSQAQLEYHYFSTSKIAELRTAQLAIQTMNTQTRKAYDEARIAIEQGNQQVAQQKLAFLKQTTDAKIRQEEANTQLLQKKISQVDLKEAETGFDQTSKEIETTVNEINQLAGTASPATQYLVDGLNVHLQQLIKQRDLYNSRLEQLQKTSSAPASTAPQAGALQTGTYQGHRAITDGVHIWNADTHELLK